VTERARTQQQLLEAEARTRSLMAATFDVTTFSREGVIVDMTGAIEAVLGYKPEQMIGRELDAHSFQGFLIKPYILAQLFETVQTALSWDGRT
jgi:PAS domain-containing protein